jgi:2-C-methyl-D-erythritol 2,4-cyclodiphosphate synthase
MNIKVGIGYDIHQLVEGRPLILGGVTIPYEKGLKGHSDADVLLHSITDAILGAAAMGDIGRHFPDTDPEYKGADSMELLAKMRRTLMYEGYSIGNVDATIVAEEPSMKEHIDKMRENIAEALQCDVSDVSVKATTNEKLGAIGQKQGIAAHSVALIVKG